jgi:hypothetical protein
MIRHAAVVNPIGMPLWRRLAPMEEPRPELEAYVASGALTLVRDAAADFRCPVLGDPQPLG